MEDVVEQVEAVIDESAVGDNEAIEDDRLRLIFTCCHPTLAPDARVALTLREVGGLTTEEIAQAFLSAAPTLARSGWTACSAWSIWYSTRATPRLQASGFSGRRSITLLRRVKEAVVRRVDAAV